MDLLKLKYLQAVAAAGSLTAAARALRISQPSLTSAMRKLEAELGTTLLLRDKRGVQLTSTGAELLRCGGAMLSLLEEAEQRIRGLEREDVGRFVVGCPDALGAYFLPLFLRRFLRDTPRIELSLWTGPSRAVQKALIDRDVHFGLVVNPLPHPDLVLLELFDDATDLFVAPELQPATTSRAAAEERLRTEPLVLVEGLPQSQEIQKRLAERRLLPERRLACGTLELVKSLTLGGVGVGILPRRVAAYGRRGVLRRLHPSLPNVRDTVYLAFRADLHKTRAAVHLKDTLVAYGRKEAATPP
jgi:DNA-binding transcriptional LysR family regulator